MEVEDDTREQLLQIPGYRSTARAGVAVSGVRQYFPDFTTSISILINPPHAKIVCGSRNSTKTRHREQPNWSKLHAIVLKTRFF
jgi:hypothetical protein